MDSDGKLRQALTALRQKAAGTVRDGSLLIPLAAAVACNSRAFRGISCGHDSNFHLVSWLEVRRSWTEGVLYPHWTQTPNWSAGEPRFIFYPPISWLLGALISCLGHWNWVSIAVTFLALTATGLATRILARQFLPNANATLAGILATTTPYALFTAFERTAYSELLAASLIPLLLLFAWRTSPNLASPNLVSSSPDPPSPSRAPLPVRYPLFSVLCSLFPIPCSLVLAAIWLTNAPTGVMASYLLAFASLAAAILLRAWWPILRALIAVPLALGLAAFYLIPAAWEQRWIAIQQAVDVGMRISDSWLFARHSSSDLELHDQVLRLASSIVVFTAVTAVAALGISVVRCKLSPKAKHFWLPLALLIPGLFWLQLPASAFVWDWLPKLQFLQFPWRWLVVLDVPFTVFLAAATPLSTRRSRIWSGVCWTAILLFAAGVGSLLFYQNCDAEDEIHHQRAVFAAATGVEGTDEYAPLGSDNSLVASGLPDACLVSDPNQVLGESDSGPDLQSEPIWYEEQGSCDDTFSAKLWQNEHKTLDIDSDHDGFVILRLRRYPAWQIHVNGSAVDSLPVREDGLIAVPVPAGPSTIDVRWTITPDIHWGRWVSLAALLVLLALALLERWLRRRQYSQVHL